MFPLIRNTMPQWAQKTFTRITTFLNGPLSGQGHDPLGSLACSWGLFFEDCLLYNNKDPWALAVENLSGDPLPITSSFCLERAEVSGQGLGSSTLGVGSFGPPVSGHCSAFARGDLHVR
jgi:hypothetical protein